MIEKLTPAQESLMIETRDEALGQFFGRLRDRKGIDRPAFEKGIAWLYNDLLKRPTPKIVYCNSWLDCIMTLSILNNLSQVWAQVRAQVWAQVWAQVGAQVWSQVGDQVRAQVGAQVWAQVGDQVRDQVWAQVGAQVWDQVRDQVGDQVEAQVWAQVGAQVWAQVGDQVRAQVGNFARDVFSEDCTWLRCHNIYWIYFFKYFQKIGVYMPEILVNNFNNYESLINSGAFAVYPFKNMVFAVEPPYIVRNSDHRLHSTTGPAVEFPDGTSYYFINGRAVPRWVVEERETITRERFFAEKNAEIRAAIYEVLGPEKMLQMLAAQLVDTKTIRHRNGDEETVRLFKSSDNFEEAGDMPLSWVEMTCPSTGTRYLMGVYPTYIDALEAIASLSPFSADEYSYDLRS